MAHWICPINAFSIPLAIIDNYHFYHWIGKIDAQLRNAVLCGSNNALFQNVVILTGNLFT